MFRGLEEPISRFRNPVEALEGGKTFINEGR